MSRQTPLLKGFGSGGHPKKFSYTYEHLAELFQMSIGAVRKAAHDGRLQPDSLQSVCEFWKAREQKIAKRREQADEADES